jgi:beta-carotene hydroxylase
MALSASPCAADGFREEKRRERAIAAKYRNDFAWRIVAEFVRDFGAWLAVTALAASGAIPLWLGCLANGWIAYLMYMTLHEATHGNVSGPHGNLRWVDDWIGSLSALPMWFSYRSHRISHMQHHAHTNDPKRDPDYFVAGPFRAVLPKYALLSFLMIAMPVLSVVPGGQRLLPRSLLRGAQESDMGTPLERGIQRRFTLYCVGVFLALSMAGYFWEALLLWYLPSRIGFFIVVVVFAWLPHHPHNERGRYRDTRITLFPGGTLLIRGQNHHLLHHMFPRVPHYRLPALFREIRPILEAKGARIEGPLAGPGAPPILLRFDPNAVEKPAG